MLYLIVILDYLDVTRFKEDFGKLLTGEVSGKSLTLSGLDGDNPRAFIYLIHLRRTEDAEKKIIIKLCALCASAPLRENISFLSLHRSRPA